MSCSPREEFQIGWICSLPIEVAAAVEMLDENFGLLDEQDAIDPNTYTLGRIGKHHVVIACLPGGQYGACAVTTVANNMIRSFSKSLRIGLMVGVGGGIPSADHDIRLGDIVISYPTGTCGGVVQYDMGKVGNEFCRTGSLNSPSRSLLTAVNSMRAAELTDDWEEVRSEREDNDPRPHYGIIASGNSVIKHGRKREQLRLKTEPLCFEMEAAGLMMDFPCIVIRGICDYSDSHKNKQWQGYAALAAASYAKELLGNLATDVCRSIEYLDEEVKDTNQRLDRAYNQQEHQYLEQTATALTDQQRRCHQVFKISSYEGQKDINPKRVPGTCQWVSQNPQYIRWWDSCSNDLLWVSADPGCGKSVLARSLIDEDFRVSTSTASDNLAIALCAILHQLFSQQPNLLQHAIPSWEQNGDKLQHEVSELWRIFLSAASADPTSHKTICVLDALDECRMDDQKQLIQKLNDFYNHSDVQNQKIWLNYDEIKTNFQEITDSQKLEQQILQMEHRTYLWLHLAINDIRTTLQDSLRPADEPIQPIPSSVNAAYARILDRVPSNQVNTVKKILQIIVGARRPLTIEEMAMALGLATRPISRNIAEAGLDSMGLENKIRRLCGLFVFINDSRIYLSHQTVREFLVRKEIAGNLCSVYSFDQKEAEDQLSQICALMPFEVIPKMDAIHLAAFNGHTHIMRLIHENRDNVHKRDSGGSTALMWASLNGHYEIVQMLLEQGANFNAQGKNNDTALHLLY
ncbi:uncharacterized protein ASPGLDRAFT_65124 [Aspergillus glaucus CBS 516.65]|uniref:Uncharacterized protein n=1 Tax=Aspergillus glaucus CBS 516.65 TaxID=1160497 RepID=A0A1L9VPW4_ASPGL|nr:hypothetical protein ASPGLDRAFT_65124 [Aspergillus glaucus CBS 516.65]OJJ85924.1 hypothetical protein ASPGLDRAFT_65124 [Aspergillus glaucus CBS 516.65]